MGVLEQRDTREVVGGVAPSALFTALTVDEIIQTCRRVLACAFPGVRAITPVALCNLQSRRSFRSFPSAFWPSVDQQFPRSWRGFEAFCTFMGAVHTFRAGSACA